MAKARAPDAVQGAGLLHARTGSVLAEVGLAD